jgi:mannose-6-phosphate isomerase-like protein (cupin superfamily)
VEAIVLWKKPAVGAYQLYTGQAPAARRNAWSPKFSFFAGAATSKEGSTGCKVFCEPVVAGERVLEKTILNKVVDLNRARTTSRSYDNYPIADVNDHVVRISIMTEPFYWHLHPNSDEGFLVIEGRLGIDLPGGSVLLETGQFFTVPRGTAHRTRPLSERSVNITFESADATTVTVEQL